MPTVFSASCLVYSKFSINTIWMNKGLLYWFLNHSIILHFWVLALIKLMLQLCATADNNQINTYGVCQMLICAIKKNEAEKGYGEVGEWLFCAGWLWITWVLHVHGTCTGWDFTWHVGIKTKTETNVAGTKWELRNEVTEIWVSSDWPDHSGPWPF